MLNNLFTKGEEMVKETISSTGEILEKTTQTIGNGFDTIKSTINDFSIENIEKKLEWVGYNISKVEVSITLPPRILFQIDIEKSLVNIQNKEEALSNNKNNDDMIVSKIIQGIEKALDLKGKIKFNSKELSYLEIEVSLIPTIKLIYLDKNK